jgi:UDP-glucuronate 4-epimerase
MKVLVTGVAGFIGMHCAERLLARGDHVVGVDNLNDYYDVRLKQARLARLSGRFTFHKTDITDRAAMEKLFAAEKPERVIHLAAQAGVRHSLKDPHAYVHGNVVGFLHILEGCRAIGAGHLVYASSSSVYGANARLPFSVRDNVDHPISLYAATKKSNELMAHVYSHLYRLPVTGLRFFTVYGPWGRPDMSPFIFTRAILDGRPIDVFNHGRMRRDFTYIDDIAEGVLRTLDRVARPEAPGAVPARLYNIGNNRPVDLMTYIETLEKALGKKAIRNMLPMQPGDVQETAADIDSLDADIGFRPSTPLEVGVPRFVEWYLGYYGRVA